MPRGIQESRGPTSRRAAARTSCRRWIGGWRCLTTRFRAFRAPRFERDPGVLFARDRLEAVARTRPTTKAELLAITAVRKWQVDVVGDALLAALRGDERSPYRE